ncbi:MAG TPA: hypothetical protein VG734_24895 [Lacunisphaera sp.]|nr:hypothetical protein [Lacunisphaera sp.]
MTTQEKIQAILAAVKEFQNIYDAVKVPVISEEYIENVTEAMRKGLAEKIAAIMKA